MIDWSDGVAVAVVNFELEILRDERRMICLCRQSILDGVVWEAQCEPPKKHTFLAPLVTFEQRRFGKSTYRFLDVFPRACTHFMQPSNNMYMPLKRRKLRWPVRSRLLHLEGSEQYLEDTPSIGIAIIYCSFSRTDHALQGYEVALPNSIESRIIPITLNDAVRPPFPDPSPCGEIGACIPDPASLGLRSRRLPQRIYYRLVS